MHFLSSPTVLEKALVVGLQQLLFSITLDQREPPASLVEVSHLRPQLGRREELAHDVEAEMGSGAADATEAGSASAHRRC